MKVTRRRLLQTTIATLAALFFGRLSNAAVVVVAWAEPTIYVTAPTPFTQFRADSTIVGIIWDAFGQTFYQSINVPVTGNDQPNPVRLGTCFNPIWRGGLILGEMYANLDKEIWLDDVTHEYRNTVALLCDAQIQVEEVWTPSITQQVFSVRIDSVWDGVRFSAGSSEFPSIAGTKHNYLSRAWLSDVWDDAIENDYMGSLTVTDCLFDGVFAGISATSSPADPSHTETDTVTLDRVLMRLKRFTNTEWEIPDQMEYLVPYKCIANSPTVRFKDCLIALDGTPNPDRLTFWNLMWNIAVDDGGNYLLDFEGDATSSEIGTVPAGWTVQTGATAISTWDAAKAAWIADHPEIDRKEGDP